MDGGTGLGVIQATGLDQRDELRTGLLRDDQARVGLAPGTAFGESGQGWFRLCYAGSIERLRRGLDRLEAALQ